VPDPSRARAALGAAADRLRETAMLFPAALARLGIVDREKGAEAFDLAMPVVVTGGLRVSQRILDFVFVGLALGDAALAGLEIGFQYYFIAFGLSLALSSGTISLVSRFVGAGEPDRADLAVKASLGLAVALSAPLVAATWLYARPMVDLLTDDPATVGYGAAYLRVMMVAAAVRFGSMIGARTLAGAGDTRTPMYVRAVTVPVNVLLNALLVFGVGPFPAFGVVGAATGTLVASVLGTVALLGLLVAGHAGVRLRLAPPYLDRGVVAELVRVSAPLSGMRLARTLGRFPFLFVLGALGTPALAAYAVGRRVILLAMMPAWGYSTAASTLVGQAIGAGDEPAATDYGWQTARLAVATQLLIAVVMAGFAPWLARAFGTENVALAATFIRVFALGVAGFALSRVFRGALRAAGDTAWPFYGTVVATYLLRLPAAFLALPVGYVLTIGPLSVAPGLGWGFTGVYAAILLNIYSKAAINAGRFATGRWKAIARASEVGAGGD